MFRQPFVAPFCTAFHPQIIGGHLVDQDRLCSPETAAQDIAGHDLTVRGGSCEAVVAFLIAAPPAWWRDAGMLHMSAPCRCPARPQHLLHAVACHCMMWQGTACAERTASGGMPRLVACTQAVHCRARTVVLPPLLPML